MHVYNKNVRNSTLDKINRPLAPYSVSKSGLKKNGEHEKCLMILILFKNIRVLQLNISNLLLVIQFLSLLSSHEYTQTCLFLELQNKEKE